MNWTPVTIRELRTGLHLTQEQFAHRLGVTVGAVQRWERGGAAPSPMAVRNLDGLAVHTEAES